MAKIEIEESELRALKGATALLDELQNSPKTRRSFQRAVKELHPDTITDDDRLKDAPEIQQLNSLSEKFDKFVQRFDQGEQDREANAAFARLAGQGFTPEGIESVKKIMVDRKIADPEAAAALWEKQNPPKQLEQSGLFNSTSFGIGHKTDDPDTKLLFEDEDAYAEREFMKVLNEGA